MAVGLIDLDELLLNLSITGIGTGVIPQSQLPVSLLDVRETRRSGHPQNLIKVGLPIRIVLLEELLLLLLLNPILLKELLEELIGLVHGELVTFDLVVVVSLGRVRQSGVGLVDLVELLLGVDTVLGVLLGVPLGGQLLVGFVDVLLRGFLVQA